MTASIVIAAGGTGGHLMPALAVAAAIGEQAPDARVCFVGSQRGIGGDLVRGAGYRLHVTAVRPITRDAAGLTAPAALVRAAVQARRILRSEEAGVVLGMGGYPSLPVVAAARTLRIPSIIHEANVHPGLANEAAARLTANIAVSFPQTLSGFTGREPRLTGVPLRAQIAELDRAATREHARKELSLDPSRVTLLVAGGSLGAQRLNAAVADLVARWHDRSDVQVVWSTGAAGYERAAAGIGAGALIVRALPFIERMDLAYAAADVALCRAGASTVAELAAARLPSLLVPYPFARRKEQHHNAEVLAGVGAARVMDDAHVDGPRLAAELEPLLADRVARARMADAAGGVSRPDAAGVLANWVLELAGSR